MKVSPHPLVLSVYIYILHSRCEQQMTHNLGNNTATSYNVNKHDMAEVQESKDNVLNSW